MPEIMGGGAALFDMDDDGDLDAYLVQSGSLDGKLASPNRLFRNEGKGRFLDVTEGSGAGDTRYGNGVACGDVDDDGDTDVYVTNTGRNTLLVNQGGGRFLDATDAAGVGNQGWGTSAAFFDADADGRLDLFVTNYLDWSLESDIECLDALSRPDYCGPKNYKTPARDLFYRNVASGRFEDESQASGVSASPGTGMGVGCADFDADGNVDVFVANDGMDNRLWLGRGDCTFVDRAMEWGCATDTAGLKKAGMGVALGDVDDDLDEDLLVCNLAKESDSLYLNGGAYFVDSTARRGLANVSKSFTRFGMGLIDFDADGRLDLFQANGRVQRQRTDVAGDPYAEENLLFRCTESGRFVEVLPRGGTAVPIVATSRAAAFGDVNGDGAVDILVVDRDEQARLLLNRGVSRNHALHFRVRERSGRDALGASLTLEVDGRKAPSRRARGLQLPGLQRPARTRRARWRHAHRAPRGALGGRRHGCLRSLRAPTRRAHGRVRDPAQALSARAVGPARGEVQAGSLGGHGPTRCARIVVWFTSRSSWACLDSGRSRTSASWPRRRSAPRTSACSNGSAPWRGPPTGRIRIWARTRSACCGRLSREDCRRFERPRRATSWGWNSCAWGAPRRP